MLFLEALSCIIVFLLAGRTTVNENILIVFLLSQRATWYFAVIQTFCCQLLFISLESDEMVTTYFDRFKHNMCRRVYEEHKLLRLGSLLKVQEFQVRAEITNKNQEGKLNSSFSGISFQFYRIAAYFIQINYPEYSHQVLQKLIIKIQYYFIVCSKLRAWRGR